MSENKSYKRLVIGGTFDLLHHGHKIFLLNAFNLADFVVIGLTIDEFNKRRGKITSQNQTQRKKNLERFLKQEGLSNKYQIILIDNVEGETLKDNKLEAMIITDDTEKSAEWINRERIKKGFKPLELIKIPFVKDLSDQVLSSSRIREGEVDDSGIVFKQYLNRIAGIKLFDSIKEKLKSPQGKLIRSVADVKSDHFIIAVGDITVKSFFEAGVTPNLSVVDFKTRRKLQFNKLEDLNIFNTDVNFSVSNPAGEVSNELIDAMESALQKKTPQIIFVEGEEDLAVIPAVLLSPLNTGVYYGQPDQGIVEIMVSGEVKARVLDLISGI